MAEHVELVVATDDQGAGGPMPQFTYTRAQPKPAWYAFGRPAVPGESAGEPELSVWFDEEMGSHYHVLWSGDE